LSRPIRRASPILAGLIAVAVALGWSESHPARPILELVGNSAFDRGAMPKGTFGRHSWTLRNVGIERLQLRTRFTSGRSGFSLWLGEDHVIEPGCRITVHLTWAIPTAASQPFANYATLRTNDPTRPEFRLRVVGTSDPASPSP
jgi:hypothetical protein